MAIGTMLLAAKGVKPPPKRTAYPIDDIAESDITLYKGGAQAGQPEFLGFGEHEGHKTVKFRLSQGNNLQMGVVKFLVEQRITRIVYKRDKPQYTNANAYKSIAEIPYVNTSQNANGLAAAANVWYNNPLMVVRSGEYFGVSINNTSSWPVVIEFYLIDDLTPF